jgi:hypothetical protein
LEIGGTGGGVNREDAKTTAATRWWRYRGTPMLTDDDGDGGGKEGEKKDPWIWGHGS